MTTTTTKVVIAALGATLTKQSGATTADSLLYGVGSLFLLAAVEEAGREFVPVDIGPITG